MSGVEPPGDAPVFAHLAAIVEFSDDAIVSKMLSGTIRTWNAGAERLFGHTSSAAVGESITLIIPPELRAQEQQILQRISRGERIEHFDTLRLTKDGRSIAISLSVSPVRDANGTIVAAAEIARDISKRKLTEEKLKVTEAALLEADRRKDEFMALLAHELRNPLAPIRYALATIKSAESSEAQRKQAEAVIERQSAQMSRLLDDLLDMSRITRGTLALKKSVTELTVVLGAAIEAARPLLDAKHHALSLDLPKQAVRLWADSGRLTQVFSNLLINAAKYTDAHGRIEIRAEQLDEAIFVSFRDNGIGISQAMLPKIFKLFSQDEAAIARAEGGLGIGLSLVEGVVALHQGHVEARSDGPGRGSEFIVRIPMGCLHDQEPLSAAGIDVPTSAVGLKVLIVDDNPDIADSCSILVELSGHHVQTAYTARQALDLAAISVPHVILADIGLPDMDGYEMALRIRSAPWGGNVVLVAITGWGQEEDKRQAVEAGFRHHLTKPIDPTTLELLLQAVEAELYAAPNGVRNPGER